MDNSTLDADQRLRLLVEFAVSNESLFTEIDPDGMKRFWIERAKHALAEKQAARTITINLLDAIGDELVGEVVELANEQFAPGGYAYSTEKVRSGLEAILRQKIADVVENFGDDVFEELDKLRVRLGHADVNLAAEAGYAKADRDWSNR